MYHTLEDDIKVFKESVLEEIAFGIKRIACKGKFQGSPRWVLSLSFNKAEQYEEEILCDVPC
jgi:hypothetical protein